MKKIILIAVAILSLASMAFAGTIEKEFDIAKGKKLTLDLDTGGAVYISGWDKDKVGVKVHVFGVDESEYEINFDAGSSAVTINSDYKGWLKKKGRHGGNFEFDIKVPGIFDIDIETMGGEVSIADIEGKITGKTMGGTLDFKNIKGDVDFETMGGEIRVEKATGVLNLETKGGDITVVDSKADGKVTTYGGKIQIENVEGNLKGSTMGGDVTYDNVSGQSSGGGTNEEVRVSSMGGEINIDEAPKGATLETMGGEITVKSAKEFVKAETMGGDIRIDEIDGWVDVSTMGGNVVVNMVGDPNKGRRDVDISSLGGDIELTVPEGLSMDFDIEIAFTKDSHEDCDIISDFDIKRERTDKWEGRWGDKKKYIYGTGEVGGGKNRIKIRTINGDVHIKKGR